MVSSVTRTSSGSSRSQRGQYRGQQEEQQEHQRLFTPLIESVRD
jgi:hypothetical protein